MSREINRLIFENTENRCKENDRFKESIRNSLRKQELFPEVAGVPSVVPEYREKARVIVSKKRTFEAASAYKGLNTAVHNFASATNPGGGVTRGSSAQEEALCRCSTLYFCLNTDRMWEGFYLPHRESQNSLHNDDCIYTPGITVFKSDTTEPKELPEIDWFEVSVITCAAPNLRTVPSNEMYPGERKSRRISDKELKALHEKRLRRILDIAVCHECEAIILGAFGCGAFANNPNVVASAAAEVIPQYLYRFRVIEFAVYCGSRDETNYKAFHRAIKSL